MPRGAYDLTDPAAYKSSAAAAAIQMHEAKVKTEQAKAAEEQAAAHTEKLIKAKRSRGIMNAKKAAKEATGEAAKLTNQGSEIDSDATLKR